MSGVGWTPSNDLFACSDDRALVRYALTGEVLERVAVLDAHVTAMRWLMSVKGGQLTADCLALGCSDGAVRLMGSNGRVERLIGVAHTGSVLCCAWSADGSSLLTGGEDGLVKQWSRSGHLRSKLCAVQAAVTSICWAPDQERFAFTHGRAVQLHSLSLSLSGHSTAASSPSSSSSSSGSRQWVAHSGPVLCSDWHPMSGHLLTGGEDGVYRVWSEDGELLHASRPFDFAVSAVRWSPSGRYFAVGAFNLIALCDASGWAHSRQRCSTGTLTALDWTADGTHLAGAGSCGSVLLAQLIDRSSEWQTFTCRLTEKNSLAVFDLGLASAREGGAVDVSDSVRVEELEFSSPVIEWSFAHSALVVATTRSCHVFKAPHFSSAAVVELRGAVELILQSEKAFALIDSIRGVQLLSYDGKPLTSLRLPLSVSLSSMHSNTVQMTGDVVVVAGRGAPGAAGGGGGVIHVLDALQGRRASESISHPHEVTLLCCSQSGAAEERQLAFIDRNRDLFVCPLTRSSSSSSTTSSSLCPVRLASSVDECRWNDSYEVLSCISEGQLRCFFLPHAPAIDPDCVAHTTTTLTAPALHAHPTTHQPQSRSDSSHSSSLGSRSALLSFSRTLLTLRTSSGTQLAVHCSPYPLFLHRCAGSGEWSRALRLCRLLSSADDARLCWAVLYGLAVQSGQLEVAGQAAALLDWPDKARALHLISRIPSEAGRRGALAAYQRRFDRAESIYLAAQLPLRAIQLHLDRFHWQAALNTAKKANAHIDTVLLARRTHLKAMQQQLTHRQSTQQGGTDEEAVEESLPDFLAMAAVQVDAEAVAAKMRAEWRKEEGKKQPYSASIRCKAQHLADAFTADDLLAPDGQRRQRSASKGVADDDDRPQPPVAALGLSHDEERAAVELSL